MDDLAGAITSEVFTELNASGGSIVNMPKAQYNALRERIQGRVVGALQAAMTNGTLPAGTGSLGTPAHSGRETAQAG